MASQALSYLLILVVIGIAFYLAVKWKEDSRRKRGRLPTAADPLMSSLVIPRNNTNSFTRAEALRDALYEAFNAKIVAGGAPAVGYKSYPQSGQVWLRFDFRLPTQSEFLSLRSSLTIEVERFDYHQFELVLAIEIIHGARRMRVDGVLPGRLGDAEIANLIRVTHSGERLPQTLRGVRGSAYELWLPRNAVKAIRPDWQQQALVGFCAVALVLTLNEFAHGAGALFLAIGVALLVVYMRRRKTFILSTGKPVFDPRAGIRLDYWQANVEHLGTRREDVRTELLKRLSSSSEREIFVAPEQIWYAGVDGKVEREQIVIRFRRAIGFVQIESYGEDLFVGWDTYVNSGTWIEETLSRGIDRVTGAYVAANRVVPGTQRPTEYDINDVNFLTEWLHAAVVRSVRLKMEELKIDQEIDFTIQRESRNAALSEGGTDRSHEPTSAVSRFSSGLRRVG